MLHSTAGHRNNTNHRSFDSHNLSHHLDSCSLTCSASHLHLLWLLLTESLSLSPFTTLTHARWPAQLLAFICSDFCSLTRSASGMHLVWLVLADQLSLSPASAFWLGSLIPQGSSWVVRRTYEDFRVLDKHLHLCIFDRHFSQLPELPRLDSLKDKPEVQNCPAHISLSLVCCRQEDSRQKSVLSRKQWDSFQDCKNVKTLQTDMR